MPVEEYHVVVDNFKALDPSERIGFLLHVHQVVDDAIIQHKPVHV